MAKTKEELNQLKIEYETLNNKLNELSEDELKLVTGGANNQLFTYYVGPEGRVCGIDVQVGDYFTSDASSGSRGVIIYRLESRDSISPSNGITTKFTVNKSVFLNYTIETNVPIILSSSYSRINKPDWIKD